MLVISHRGNLSGPNEDAENQSFYIKRALEKCDFVEVDIWIKNGIIKLGHDKPQHAFDLDLLNNLKIIWHAKTLEALKYLKSNKLHYFFHDKDEYTITSHGFIWAHPTARNFEGCICVMPEQAYGKDFINKDYNGFLGICTDYPIYFMNKISHKENSI